MQFQTMISKQFKSSFGQRKMLSQYVFPINQNFSTIKFGDNCEKSASRNKLKNETSSIHSFSQFPVTSRSQRIQTFTSNLTVSQIQNKGPVQQMTRTYCGIYPQKTANKNIIVYKKRLASLDISNVNELNVTSFRNFKIKSSTKSKKNRTHNSKLTIINKSLKNYEQAAVFRIQKSLDDRKLPMIQTLSPLKRKCDMKIKWQKSQRFDVLPSFNSTQLIKQNHKIHRKNSISPWDNGLE